MRLTAHRRLSPLCLEISPSPTYLHAEEMSAHSPSHDSIITLSILHVHIGNSVSLFPKLGPDQATVLSGEMTSKHSSSRCQLLAKINIAVAFDQIIFLSCKGHFHLQREVGCIVLVDLL